MILLRSRMGQPDPYWANVVSMSNCQGLNASTVLRDEKGKVWSPTGDTKIDTSVKLFGGSSIYFDGSGDFWTSPDSADFAFGTGDFTLEHWVYSTGLANYRRMISQQDVSPFNAWLFRQNNSSKIDAIAYTSGSPICILASTSSLTSSTWTFVSWTRSGSNFYLHFNGIMEASGSNAGAMPDCAFAVQLGRYHDGGSPGEYWLGNLGPHRVTKGISRYGSGNYTPPSGPFPTFGP